MSGRFSVIAVLLDDRSSKRCAIALLLCERAPGLWRHAPACPVATVEAVATMRACWHVACATGAEQVRAICEEETMHYRRTMSASSLTGDKVYNTMNEDLGKIEDMMIDVESGRVAYAVLSFGGFLGMGDKLFAIPWTALRLDEERKCFVLDVDKKTLETAPGFDKDHWPDLSSADYQRSVYTHYGQKYPT